MMVLWMQLVFSIELKKLNILISDQAPSKTETSFRLAMPKSCSFPLLWIQINHDSSVTLLPSYINPGTYYPELPSSKTVPMNCVIQEICNYV